MSADMEVQKKSPPQTETAVAKAEPPKAVPAVPKALQPTTPAIWKDKLKKMEGELENALVKRIPTELFIRSALTMINKTPKLLECTPTSVLAALMEAAQIGLIPDTTLGYCYILPYKGHAEFQLGYKGLVKLIRDEGGHDITAEVVYAKDEFDYSLGTEKFLKHKPAYLEDDRGEIRAAWAMARDAEGRPEFRILPVKRLKEIRAMSKSPDSPAWVKSLAEMYMKVVLKVFCKTQNLSPKVKEIIEQDDKRDFGDMNATSNIISRPKFDDDARKATPAAPATEPAHIPPKHEAQNAEYADIPPEQHTNGNGGHAQ